jgi:hypothetical protein
MTLTRTGTKMRQNLGWAICYSSIAAGAFEPWDAAT